MEASQHYSGVPPPPGNVGPPLRLSPGDVVEAMVAEVEQLWWQVGGGWGAVGAFRGGGGTAVAIWGGGPPWGRRSTAAVLRGERRYGDCAPLDDGSGWTPKWGWAPYGHQRGGTPRP